ncbi:MAG TPA: SUMF1/EgtB/PvdO family nonheme iron enzyme [Aggregatilineales bacterium]|nr:SUMF1/EgtB/PvdO family nonheme iron enzyme [Aggregatilineales bacterium]
MSHIFISYSKQDISFARHLRGLLQQQGLAVWMDETRLTPSARWWPTIEQNIITADAVIVIMSPRSQTSDWVERELLLAEAPENRRPIFPVLLDGKPWSRLANLQYADMTHGVQAGLPPGLVEALRQVVKPGTGQPTALDIPGDMISEQLFQRSRFRGLWVGLVLLLIVAVLGGVAAFLYVSNRPPATPTPVLIAADVVQVSATATQAPTNQPATASATPTATLVPPSATLTATPSPIPPTATLTSTAVPPTATSTATLTPTLTSTFTATATVLPPTLTMTPSATPTRTLPPTPGPGSLRYDPTGVRQVYVPAGCFMMGSTSGDSDEQPVHEVCITTPYWIDLMEVSVRDWKAFIDAGGYGNQANWTPEGWAWAAANGPSTYTLPENWNIPIVNVSWYEADAYARWRGCRLPSEAEWEYAARGPAAPIFPWGSDFTIGKAQTNDIGLTSAAPGGEKPEGASWVGAMDMAGNVWEWVADWHDKDYYALGVRDNPPGPAVSNSFQAGDFKVLRGGSFQQDLLAARSADRYWAPPGGRAEMVGFRVVCGA